jgi:hypothetical protein
VGFDEGGQLTGLCSAAISSRLRRDRHTRCIQSALADLDDNRRPDGHARSISEYHHYHDQQPRPGTSGLEARIPAFRFYVLVLGGAQAMRPVPQPHRQDHRVPALQEQLVEIVGLQAAHLAARLVSQGIGLEITDAAKQYLAREGYNPDFGARPLRRLIQKEIENVIARQVLGGEVKHGDHIRIDHQHGRLVFETGAPAAAEIRG